LFELASMANRNKDSQACGQMKVLGAVLGLLQQDPAVYFQSPTRYTRRAMENAEQGQPATASASLTEQQIESLIQERAAAKQAKNFAQADSIRATLKAAGIEIDDKPGGLTQWRRA
jgi:cysteinyl-tRNA synthetase